MSKTTPSPKSSKGKTMSKTAEKPAEKKPETAQTNSTAPPQPENSAQPGTKADPDKVLKVPYPGLTDDEGNTVLLKEWPKDHNPKLHRVLRARDFEDETIYLLHTAEMYEKRAKALRDEAEKLKKLGSRAEREQYRKLQQLFAKSQELAATLKEKGLALPEGVEDIIKSAE